MTFDIQIMAWDMHNKVAGFKLGNAIPPLVIIGFLKAIHIYV